MKKILVLHTGGTIAMKEEEQGTIPAAIHPLYSTIESLASIASVTVDDFLNLPSPHMTPALMVDLAKRLRERSERDGLDGIVVTHGTDTLEETAYMLDLLVNWQLPVVITGAMRSSNELGADGPHNLITAVRVATCDEARGKGVLVVMNDEIHSAKNVTKTHASNIATFQSPQYGPLGIVTKRDIFFHHTVTKRESYPVSMLTKKVILLKVYTGMERTIIDLAMQSGADGLVIEAFGQGNVPPEIVPALEELIERNIPIVLVSRCFSGVVQDNYAYAGGGRELRELGVIFTNGLNGQKARLKLMVTLEKTNDRELLQSYFLQ
ncbi:asparaginase [Alkalihalobacillus oceani]|uniref:asparaginase n=1 Tax=Halalkalibacter oceani TaxID=1653776 RepID=UPI0020420578|nr:asparaginase [Halalkalibacter oceani]MCM3763023.1 asparaginase [Halalkalibacter oceani]